MATLEPSQSILPARTWVLLTRIPRQKQSHQQPLVAL